MTTTSPSEPMVRVRIAVAIDAEGRWSATGYAGWKDEEAAGESLESLDSPCAVVHFVEAEIPLPSSLTLKGQIV